MARRAISAMVTVVAALLPLVILTPPSAWASCFGMRPAASQYRAADVVFTGSMVLREDLVPRRRNVASSLGHPVRLIFAVHRIYKGTVGPVASVRTLSDDRSHEGLFLVFAKQRANDRELHAAPCGGVRPAPKPLPAVLGTGYPPTGVADGQAPALTDSPSGSSVLTPGPGDVPIDVMPVVNEPSPTAPWLAGVVAGLVILAVPGWLLLRVLRRRA